MLQLITPPYAQPISIADAKLYARVDGNAEDVLVSGFIMSARERAENRTQRQLITATYKFSTDKADGENRVYLPRPPLQAVSGIQYVDYSGNVQTAAPSTYRVVSTVEPGYVVFTTPPACDGTREDAIQITFTCGYGFQEDVPEAIKTAMRWHVGNLYFNREEMEALGESSVDRMLDLYRVWR